MAPDHAAPVFAPPISRNGDPDWKVETLTHRRPQAVSSASTMTWANRTPAISSCRRAWPVAAVA